MTDDLVFSNLISRYVKYDLDNEYSIKEQKKEFISFVLIFCLLSNTNQSFSRYGEETFCFCRKFISNFVFRKQKKGTNFMEQLTRTSFQDIYSLYYKK